MKKILTLILTLTLLSCGFSPMYSDDIVAARGDIFISKISGTTGIDMRNMLTTRFTAPDESAKYVLDVRLSGPETIYKALQISGDATWQEVRITANYTLRADDKIILSATDSASESYTFVRDLVASQAAYNTAVQNVVRQVADKIEIRVNAKVKK
ncbi:MAG: hypothetical protein LBR41_01710 [Rickettsiales bacterium]|jgi:hypothetical protein|nr:hypothetical protein [Rickettsiales bacterium]